MRITRVITNYTYLGRGWGLAANWVHPLCVRSVGCIPVVVLLATAYRPSFHLMYKKEQQAFHCSFYQLTKLKLLWSFLIMETLKEVYAVAF